MKGMACMHNQLPFQSRQTLKEAYELVEAGFENVTDMQERKILRKRK